MVPACWRLAAFFGTGQIVTEVVADTTLQRALDPAVFGRAYGIVLSASIAGVAAGALLAPLAVSLLGLEGALIAAGALTMGYAAAIMPRRLARAFRTFAGATRGRAGRTRRARPA